jgi:hypothetical protein
LFPFGQSDLDDTRQVPFKISNIPQSQKVGVLLSWNFNVCLSSVSLFCKSNSSRTNYEAKIQDTARFGAERCSVKTWSPTSGALDTVITLIGEGMNQITKTKINGVEQSHQIVDDTIAFVYAYNSGLLTIETAYDTIQLGNFVLS